MMNLKISQGVHAIEIKSQVNSTGFQVRTTYDMESDTIEPFFCFTLHFGTIGIKQEDQKVLSPVGSTI